MKVFLIKIFAVLLSVIACDVCFGLAFDYFREHAKGGETGRTNYICDKSNEEVLTQGFSFPEPEYLHQRHAGLF